MGYGDSQLLEELEKIASKNGLSDRFSVYGPVPSELVPQFTSSADVGVAPIMNSCLSYYLCSPNKVFEYMHAGIPVVASDFPELRKVVMGQNIGYVFNPEEPQDIARSIRKVLDVDGTRNQLRLNSMRSSRKYNWGLESRKLQGFYIDLYAGEIEENPRIESSSNQSKISRLLEDGETPLSDIDENVLPGNNDWGAPRGKESTRFYNACLNKSVQSSRDPLHTRNGCI